MAAVQDCDPALGPPCKDPEHTDRGAPMYDTVEQCCGRLSWVDFDTCTGTSTDGTSDKYWAEYTSGSCKKDCPEGEEAGCKPVPPPIGLFDSIDACCSEGMNWVNNDFCTSRSGGGYTDLWVVDYMSSTCGELFRV